MKYVYVLVSDDSDFYLEQALLSMTSLKLRMSDAFISLLIDDVTEKTFTEKRRNILNLVDELKVITIDDRFNKKARSRWLKTSMRQHIEGDFLYIDCDTIITEELIELEKTEVNIGAVLDLHIDFTSLKKYDVDCVKSRQDKDAYLGFVSSINADIYFNGGIIFCRDCQIGYDFFKEWHRLWLFCFEKGIVTDQQSFNQTNYSFGNIITELDGKWNCQILTGGAIRYLYTAKIIHYFAENSEEKPYTIANQNTFEKIKETGIVDSELKNMLLFPKSLFAQNTRLILINQSILDFNNSLTFAWAKRLFHSRFGHGFERIFVCLRNYLLRPLRKILQITLKKLR